MVTKPTSSAKGASTPGGSGLRERQKQARRQRILASAARLVHERGIDGTTIADVAAASDVSPATVFNYFASKDDLLVALIVSEQEDWLRGSATFEADPETDPARQVAALYVSITESSLNHFDRAFWRNVEAARLSSPSSPVIQAYDASAEVVRAEMRRRLRRMVDVGLLPPSFGTKALAAFLYDHWVDLFMELMRREEVTLADHRRQLESDVAELLRACGVDRQDDVEDHDDTDR